MVKEHPDVIVYFFDEGRFGLQPTVGRRWARKGVRSLVNVAIASAPYK